MTGPGDTIGLIVVCGVLLAVVIVVGEMFKRFMSYKERKAELLIEQTAEKAAQYASQNRELEDRMRVLERIVTDKGYDVGTQIEALRDTRRVEENS